jgi:hypothetical protein
MMLDIDLQEFRGFVHQKKLTAISQYIASCYFEDMAKQKTQFQDTILQYFNNILCPLLPFENCVIDFAVLGLNEVKLIEINPWVRLVYRTSISSKINHK